MQVRRSSRRADNPAAMSAFAKLWCVCLSHMHLPVHTFPHTRIRFTLVLARTFSCLFRFTSPRAPSRVSVSHSCPHPFSNQPAYPFRTRATRTRSRACFVLHLPAYVPARSHPFPNLPAQAALAPFGAFLHTN